MSWRDLVARLAFNVGLGFALCAMLGGIYMVHAGLLARSSAEGAKWDAQLTINDKLVEAFDASMQRHVLIEQRVASLEALVRDLYAQKDDDNGKDEKPAPPTPVFSKW